MGPLSHEPRENLYVFTMAIIYAIPHHIKNILGLGYLVAKTCIIFVPAGANFTTVK